MERAKLVLENSLGEVARVFNTVEDRFYLIYRHDIRRVEVHSSVEDLAEQGISFDLLAELTSAQVKQNPFKIANVGTLRLVQEVEQFHPEVNIPEEDPRQFRGILKWTGIVHVVLLVFVLTVGYFVRNRMQSEEPQVVKVFSQDDLFEKKDPVPTVTMKEKIQKIKNAPKIVKAQTRKSQPKHKIVKSEKFGQGRGRGQTHLNRVDVNKLGAVGVLGGMPGGKGRGGLNVNAIDPNGGLGTGMGQGARGGALRSLMGKGLIAAPAGDGTPGYGGGGYGTKGKAGGQPGYGTHSMVGGSAGYSEPLEQEANVDGGLDRDQVAQVIFRHMGQITYCYEKGLQVKPELKGRVAVKFIINPAGGVATSGIAHSSVGARNVEQCILGYLNTWKFPRPQGGVNVKVTYPFVLRRVSQR